MKTLITSICLAFGSMASVVAFAQAERPVQKEWKPNRVFFTAQPLTIGALPYGGLRVGAELTLGPRFGLSNDFTWRFLNPVTNVLDEGERDHTQGFQFQPELRFYFGVKPNDTEPNHRAFRGSLGLRSGYARYHTALSRWTFLTDASGQPYEKQVGYTRRQQNFDLSTVWNQKIYFGRAFEGFGVEVYAGLGLRLKRFQYLNVSPELDPDQLRREDESRMFSLRRDGVYPLLPLGFRLFYLIP